jgi:hypothetical protein
MMKKPLLRTIDEFIKAAAAIEAEGTPTVEALDELFDRYSLTAELNEAIIRGELVDRINEVLARRRPH